MPMRTTILGALAILAVVGVSLGQGTLAANLATLTPEPGKPVAGLQLALDCAAHGVLEITFENVGQNAMVINLGDMVGNGRQLEPRNLHLIVSGLSGKPRQLDWKGLAGVSGRLDDFLVPLMPGSKYTITFSLDDLIGEGKGGDWSSTVAAGEKVQAVFKGAAPSLSNGVSIPDLPIWNHKVVSTPLPYAE